MSVRAACVLTGRPQPRFLISTPTMTKSSEDISDSLNVALACAAALQAVHMQNAKEPGYRAMATDLDTSESFQAALDLVFSGRTEPNGYTERALTHWRRRAKERG